MSLSLHLFIHVLLAFLAGIIAWRASRSFWPSMLAALAAGVLVDLDHVIDYFLAFGLNFRFDYFVQGFQFLKSGKIYILFHAWEYVIILGTCFILAKKPSFKGLLLGAALGLLVHLSADVLINKIPFSSYSIAKRASVGFEIKDLVTPEHYQNHLREKSQKKFLLD